VSSAQRVLSAAGPAARQADDRVLGALPAKQREAFLTVLASIVEVLQASAPVTSRGRAT
jgi:hypothetical protein